MIDEKALEKALRTYDDYWANEDTPGEALRCAIEAYLAAAPLPTLCEDCPPIGYPTDKTRCIPCPRRSAAAPLPPAEPVAWRTGWRDGFWRYSDEKDHVGFIREDGCIVQPLYTAAPDTAQAVAAIADIAKQKLSTEVDTESYGNADWVGGYDACVIRARGAKP